MSTPDSAQPETPAPQPDAAAEAREIRRSKLIGRAILIGFGLLLLVYFIPLLLDRIS